MDRRTLLKVGALAGVAAALPVEKLSRAFTGTARAADPAPALEIPRFTLPLRVPTVLRPTRRTHDADYYDVTMRRARQLIVPGTRTPIWGYEGTFPGPTIVARRGRLVVIRQTNRLPEPSAVHLHGGNVPSESDGIPGQEIEPGRSRLFHYPNHQPAATLWYHDHTHHMEARNTYLGLTGLYLITDPEERRLHLPRGRYDIPLVLQDRSFNGDGSFRPPDPDKGEFAGEVMLVNGTPRPYLEVAQRSYRFRILNGSSADNLLDLRLSDGLAMHVIGTDGGLLPAAVRVSHLPIAPAERIEVVVDFRDVPRGSHIVLTGRNLLGQDVDVMRFDVVAAGHHHDRLPTRLADVSRLDQARATVRRSFTLNLNRQTGTMQINGKDFDPDRVDIRPKLGATEIWTVVNGEQADLPIPHVFHTHLVRFQILDRDGRPPAAEEAGWKDSVPIPPGGRVRLIMKFGDFPGRFLYHCHLLGHADAGMMAQMEVVR